MAFRIPAAADTDRKKLTVLNRAHKLLIDEHRAKRATYPDRMTAEQVREFKAWEQSEWIPRQKRLLAIRNPLHARETAGLDEVESAELKESDVADPRFDADINLRTI